MNRKKLFTIADVVSPEVLKSLGVRKRDPTMENLDGKEEKQKHYLLRSYSRKDIWKPKYNTSTKTIMLSELRKELIMSREKTLKFLVFNTIWAWDKVLYDMTQAGIKIEEETPITVKNIQIYFRDCLHLPKEKVSSVAPRMSEIFQKLSPPSYLEKKPGPPQTFHFTEKARDLGYEKISDYLGISNQPKPPSPSREEEKSQKESSKETTKTIHLPPSSPIKDASVEIQCSPSGTTNVIINITFRDW